MIFSGRCGAGLAAIVLTIMPWDVSAESCRIEGAVGLELAKNEARSAALNPDGRFISDAKQRLARVEVGGKCQMAGMEVHADFLGERIERWDVSGLLQRGHENETHGMLREGYISVQLADTVFLDVGKKDIRNGQLFFVSPMDVLQGPANYGFVGYSNSQGVAWRDGYREGAVLLHAVGFGTNGSWEVAILPRLSSEADEAGLAGQRTLQRTNPDDQLYLAYGFNRFSDFNPRIVSVLGGGSKLGVGVSGFLGQDVILTAEASVQDGSEVRRINRLHLNGFAQGVFPEADTVFQDAPRDRYTQLGLGLRYTTAQATDVSVEYLFQEQGYTDSEWDDYFDFLGLTEVIYQSSRIDAFRSYAMVFAREADDLSRKDMMMGRNYLMSHVRREPRGTRGVGLESAVIYSLDDKSYSLSLHVFSQVYRNVQVYAGGSYLGGAQKSEFGRFGHDGAGYAGFKAIW